MYDLMFGGKFILPDKRYLDKYLFFFLVPNSTCYTGPPVFLVNFLQFSDWPLVLKVDNFLHNCKLSEKFFQMFVNRYCSWYCFSSVIKFWQQNFSRPHKSWPHMCLKRLL
jgi:hypothetical protein